jgi:hypothetical protein
MRRSTRSLQLTRPLAAFGIALAIAACGSSEGDPNEVNNGGGTTGGDNAPDPNDPNAVPKTPEEQVKQILDARKTDYGEALRSASLKLRDKLPTLAEIKQLEAAPDDAAKKVAYEKLIDDMLASTDFSASMVKFWKDTFRTGQTGAVQQGQVSKDFAANFAARVVVEGKSYNDLFTATTNTCPTFDPTAKTFADGNCPAPANQIANAPTVGVLTDPGLQSQYFANMAFRRVRFVQETFICSKFPAAYSATPVPMGNGTYTGQHPFTSITGKQTLPAGVTAARIDFHDTQAVICANCHNDLNHLAPMFINYDAAGALRDTPQVEVPIPGSPKARRNDYLPDAEGYAWRFGKPVADLAALGQAIAADPDAAKCAVNRVWNFAMSRGDIVNDLASVPDAVTAPYVASFKSGNYNLKETIRAVFKSEDFTKF